MPLQTVDQKENDRLKLLICIEKLSITGMEIDTEYFALTVTAEEKETVVSAHMKELKLMGLHREVMDRLWIQP